MRTKTFFILILLSCALYAQNQRDPLLEETEVSLNQALSQNMNLFFPSDFGKSAKHYKSAIEISKDKKRNNEYRKELESSIDLLTTANEKIDDISNFFKDVMNERNIAINKSANIYAVNYWNSAEEKFKDAVSDYNDKDFTYASKAVSEIIKLYQLSELYADKATELVKNWAPLQNADSSMAFLLAPKNYYKAMNSYTKVLEEISYGDNVDKISSDVASTKTLFDNSEEIAKAFLGKYPECISVRNDARISKAETYAAKEWSQAEVSLKNAGLEFENENYDNVRKYVNDSFNNYIAAKRLSVKNQYLFVSREKLDVAIKIGAEKYAPKTYKSSLGYLQRAEQLIDSDNYLDKDVKQITNKCEADADLAFKITRLALPIETGNKTLEELILNLMTQYGNKPAATPVETREEYVPVPKETKSKTKWLGTNIYDNFSKDDVEVLESEKKIILRMFNFNFGWIQYKLNDKSKIILDKLLPVLEKFDNATFQVTSYTDYVAASEMNTKISELRAKNIADYLSDHSSFLKDKLSSAGYGENNPIADNHTLDGRIKNNRIEIVINTN